MTEAEIARAAKAISRILKATDGQAGSWALAKAALMAAYVSRDTGACERKSVAKSIEKAKSYRARAKRARAMQLRAAAARAAALAEEKTRAA
jgi:hypothetical protein